MSGITFTGSDNYMSEPIAFQGMYSDSTPMIKTLGWPRIVEQADVLTVTGSSLMQFVNAMFLVDAIENAGGRIETLVLPYIPGARQDRSNPAGDVLFTLASVAEMINLRRFDRVISLDPHSPAAGRLIYHLVEYPLSEVAKMLPGRYDGVIAADKGGKDRAEQFGRALDLPVFYGGKTRDVSNGRLTGFTLEPLSGNGHFLVVDDICDGGGTFLGLADKIKEQGATADLYVSHGIFAKGTRALSDAYASIITTDSLEPGGRELNITVLPVVKDMLNN